MLFEILLDDETCCFALLHIKYDSLFEIFHEHMSCSGIIYGLRKACYFSGALYRI